MTQAQKPTISAKEDFDQHSNIIPILCLVMDTILFKVQLEKYIVILQILAINLVIAKYNSLIKRN